MAGTWQKAYLLQAADQNADPSEACLVSFPGVGPHPYNSFDHHDSSGYNSLISRLLVSDNLDNVEESPGHNVECTRCSICLVSYDRYRSVRFRANPPRVSKCRILPSYQRLCTLNMTAEKTQKEMKRHTIPVAHISCSILGARTDYRRSKATESSKITGRQPRGGGKELTRRT